LVSLFHLYNLKIKDPINNFSYKLSNLIIILKTEIKQLLKTIHASLTKLDCITTFEAGVVRSVVKRRAVQACHRIRADQTPS